MPTTTIRDGMTVIHYSVKETAAEIRKALRAAFPATQFSVRMARGTGYGWLDVSWADGPTTTQVQAITDPFRDEKFDGMTDAYVPVEARLYTQPGEDLPALVEYSCTGANGSRSFSPAVHAWACETIRAAWPEVDTAGWTVCPAALPDDIALTHPHGNVEGHAHEFLNRVGDLTGRRL